MKPMNAFASARLDGALDKIDDAIALLDGPVGRVPRDVLLRAKGDLAAMRQLLEMEADMLEKADTERPAHLRVVR
jgi:hypothetical protein